MKCRFHPVARSSALMFFFLSTSFDTWGQAQSNNRQLQELQKMMAELQARVAALERRNASSPPDAQQGPTGPEAAAALQKAALEMKTSAAAAAPQPAAQTASTASALPAKLPGGATLNFLFDGYYEYNFNSPIGRANDLRAYDVLSNVFSINQADLVFALDPDPGAARRYGLRLDLQFGQATETLQGNPANEPRPEIYRNIFQAFATYVFPVGNGLNVDFGKWASSLGVEGNYTKDQMNYSRSFYFTFLPFYHTGFRAAYQVNQKLALNYWLVNGTNQSEPTNGFKDELFGYVLRPRKNLAWTVNYYLGQEHPDSSPAANCAVPVQPGLCFVPISPAPNGKLHIVDSYATWQATPRLTLQAEGDYVIEREWASAAPGQSSAPSRVDGGAGYVQYQVSPKVWLAARAEYLDDHGGLFSATTQALKEATGTYEYKLADTVAAFLEFRRDWSNRAYFTTSSIGAPSGHQNTAALGLVWWYGAKQGSW